MTQQLAVRSLIGLTIASAAIAAAFMMLAEFHPASKEASQRIGRRKNTIAAPEELSPTGRRLQRVGLRLAGVTVILFVLLFLVSTA